MPPKAVNAAANPATPWTLPNCKLSVYVLRNCGRSLLLSGFSINSWSINADRSPFFVSL